MARNLTGYGTRSDGKRRDRDAVRRARDCADLWALELLGAGYWVAREQDWDLVISAEGKEIAVAGDGEIGLRGECAGEDMVIIGISGNDLWHAERLGQGDGGRIICEHALRGLLNQG